MIRRLVPAAAAAVLAAGASFAADTPYEANGEAFDGYFAAAQNPKGLVLVIHDWDGLGDYERKRADMIAALGYDAFAIDLYGAGVRPETQEGRMEAMGRLNNDRPRMQALIAAGLAAAREQSGAEKVVIAGYCFGGGATLEAARAGVTDAVGYVTFHGLVATPEGESWPGDAAPVLVLHGGADKSPDMEGIAGFSRELEAAGVPYEIEVYSGAPHAFTVFGSPNYRETADVESWDAFARFLSRTLGEAS